MARDQDLDYASARLKLETASVVLTVDDEMSDWHQAALIAFVACGSRMFQGGVFLQDFPDAATRVGHQQRLSITRVLIRGGARPGQRPPGALRIHFGSKGSADLYVQCEGWTAHVGPIPIETTGHSNSNVVVGAFAAALGATAAFRQLIFNDVRASRFQQSHKLMTSDEVDQSGTITALPKHLWLLGAGNLGQAVLMILGLLPWKDCEDFHLHINDGDIVGPENVMVQVLTQSNWIGSKKARVVASWAEAQGFKTSIDERLFGSYTHPMPYEPRVALVCVDNVDARRAASMAGFDLVIDGGLGATAADLFDLRVHAFPSDLDIDRIWPLDTTSAVSELPANLKAMVGQGQLDDCGATTIAGKSVGVPSTAMACAALQVAQLLSVLMTGRCAKTVDASLADIKRAHAVMMADDTRVHLARLSC